MGDFNEDPLTFLVRPEGKATFLRDSWEKKAAHFSAKDAPRSQLKDVLDVKHLCTVLDDKEEKGQCLRFGIDCCAMAYIDGERGDLGGSTGEVLDSNEAQSLYSMGATLQVHQPQRFSDTLWKLCAALEAQLGSLVGCNAYITPANAQGLAPHWDDVSIFVLQTSGSKAWKVYGALPGCELPSASSGDIRRDSLPAPVLEVTLEVGDVLFIPRGHVHEAVALAEGSAHVTVSAYQHWTWMQMATSVLKGCNEAREPCPEVPLSLRSGLPIGFVYSQSLSANALVANKDKEKATAASEDQELIHATPASKDAAGTLAGALRKMADEIEQHPQTTSTAAQAMGLSFMRNRLPPHPDQLPASGKAPTIQSLVCCRKEGAFLLASDDARVWMHSDQDPGLNSDSDEEEDDEDLDMMGDGESEEDSDEEMQIEDVTGSKQVTEKKKGGKQSMTAASSDAEHEAVAVLNPASTAAKGSQKESMKQAKKNKSGGEGDEDTAADGDASKQGLVELDSEADEFDEEDEDSDAVIDQDELDADMEEFVVLATCLHNDRTMHMVDPRLAAAAQEDGLGGPGDSAAEIDEGDEPPYDLVPYNKDSEADGKASAPGASAATQAVDGKAKCKAEKKQGELADCCKEGTCAEEDPGTGDFGMESMPWMLDIPVDQALAVAKLLECVNGKSIRVSSLPLEDGREKMELVLALHEWGVLRTLPDEKKQIKTKQKGPKSAAPKTAGGPKTASQGTVKKTEASKQQHNGGSNSKGKKGNKGGKKGKAAAR